MPLLFKAGPRHSRRRHPHPPSLSNQVRIAEADIERTPEILAAIVDSDGGRRRLRQMQRGLARVWHRFAWAGAYMQGGERGGEAGKKRHKAERGQTVAESLGASHGSVLSISLSPTHLFGVHIALRPWADPATHVRTGYTLPACTARHRSVGMPPGMPIC